MSWQEGATYFGGMILAAIGYGMKYGIDSAMIAVGFMLIVIAISAEWE